MAVSLEKLVSLKGSRPLWPAEFAALVALLDADPNDKAAWGVAADWLDEPERGEHDLAEAFRWIHKRDAARIAPDRFTKGKLMFVEESIPTAIRNAVVEYYAPKGVEEIDASTPAGLAARLAFGLRNLKAEMF